MRFNWIRNRRARATKIRIEYSLTIADVALILVLAGHGDDAETMSKADIEFEVRDFLHWRGRDALWTWADHDDGETEAEAARVAEILALRYGVPFDMIYDREEVNSHATSTP